MPRSPEIKVEPTEIGGGIGRGGVGGGEGVIGESAGRGSPGIGSPSVEPLGVQGRGPPGRSPGEGEEELPAISLTEGSGSATRFANGPSRYSFELGGSHPDYWDSEDVGHWELTYRDSTVEALKDSSEETRRNLEKCVEGKVSDAIKPSPRPFSHPDVRFGEGRFIRPRNFNLSRQTRARVGHAHHMGRRMPSAS